jgi:hypothetical protein
VERTEERMQEGTEALLPRRLSHPTPRRVSLTSNPFRFGLV